ncbi:hypothetical protein [[Limnothrix rosea] IAM M-220]|uniref:hypothetical protein n=1 Tax=[Limnothrix rosea] IAM M-220 TaxID=454133 RepID=UPI00095F6094|nr:hypothetical protein [[Limnothrix rosea] IAM M-220]OKH19726.1 hypothetical protein NIES208_00945 [[Limnothrix rosea] IAM M-220]
MINTALNYGIGVSSAHRALTDCQLIAALFDRVSELGELDSILKTAIQRSKEAKIRAIADVSFDNKHLAKAHRFRWNPDQRYWFKDLRESDLNLEQKDYPFSIQKLVINT